MEHYLLYLAFASINILSPGPGVVLTITNAIKYGFWGAVPGILGVALGMLCIAAISATSLTLLLATSAVAFTTLKLVGAAYLVYLGIKMWLSSAKFDDQGSTHKGSKLRFTEGLLIPLLNPKPIFFFMVLFPQFIVPNKSYGLQFGVLAITFSVLVIIIHCLYSAFSKAARSSLSTPIGSRIVSRVSGSFYIFFGVGLAASDR